MGSGCAAVHLVGGAKGADAAVAAGLATVFDGLGVSTRRGVGMRRGPLSLAVCATAEPDASTRASVHPIRGVDRTDRKVGSLFGTCTTTGRFMDARCIARFRR